MKDSVEIVVLTTPAPQEKIIDSFKDFFVINDAMLFSALNHENTLLPFNFSLQQDHIIDELEYSLLELGFPKILIHTFNPLIINALEPNSSDDKRLTKSFVLYAKNIGFRNILEHKSITKKIEVMSIGEVIADTFMQDIIDDFENNKNLIEQKLPRDQNCTYVISAEVERVN